MSYSYINGIFSGHTPLSSPFNRDRSLTTEPRQFARKIPSIWLLGAASGLSPFGMAIVVPALDSIASRFDADFASVQFVISAYLFGLAVAQPVCGFFCDLYGRRPVMLAGFGMFLVASLLCAIANTLELLVLARFFQAAGVSVGTVATRAILRDTRSGDRMAEAMSYIAATMGLAPVMAPMLGGMIDASTGYAWIFIITAAIGVAVFISMYLQLSETLAPGREQPRWGNWLKSYRMLLMSPVFLGNTLVFGFVQGSFFSFMAVGAPLFASQFQIQSGTFGIIWGLMAIAYVVGATVGAKLTPRIGTIRVMHTSIAVSVIGGILVVLGANVGELSPTKVLLPLSILMMMAGSTTPGAMAGAVSRHAGIAGTASGLSSAIGLVVGGSFSIIAGSVYDGRYQPIAFIMLLAVIGTAVSWLLASRKTGYSPRPAS
jgi:DHA1 family bicyclomycin/chloramphenicol resistance-like MFS transporter